MAMYLAGVLIFTIMLLGFWSSDAFLQYIWKQVKEIRRGISIKIQNENENIFTIPSTLYDDPRALNHPLKHANHKISGPGFKDMIRPLVRVFHNLTDSLPFFVVFIHLPYAICVLLLSYLIWTSLIQYSDQYVIH